MTNSGAAIRAQSLRAVALLALWPVATAGAQPGEADRLESRLRRIFATKDLEPKPFGPARWIEGGRAYTTVEASAAVEGARDIVRYEAASGARTVLVSAERLRPAPGASPLAIDDYSWSQDGSRLLLYTNSQKVWRRNTRGDYWVLDTGSGRLRQLGAGRPAASLMFAKLAPDGTRAAYVHANDLYVEALADGTTTRLTADGSEATVNGTSDWVYEEEFDLRDGFRWSPDGSEVAFWRFDTSGVGRFPLVNQTATTYPAVTWIPYPKAGSANSAVKLGVVSAAGGPPRWIGLPGEGEHYLPRMEWVEGTGELIVQRLNRLQNRNEVWLVGRDGTARRLLVEEDAAWLDVVDDWRWLRDGRELLWASERDGWRHLWAVRRDGGAQRLLTRGGFDAIEVVGLDAARGVVYFTASPGDALRRYLYGARLDGSSAPERVTPAGQPGTHAYDVSPDGRLAFHTRSAADVPPVTALVELPSHRALRVLEDNRALAQAAGDLVAAQTQFFEVEVGEGVRLDGWLLKPPGFDPSRKYPLLMYVYGEPAAVQVTDAWRGSRMLFHRALAEAGYVVACVDNRGTPAPKGRAWRKVVYGSVGELASLEQAAAVRRLLAGRPYLDAARVASWGWSGGGSMTLNLMFRSPDLYKAGMSVAPVPDQRLYDTIYQERYMGLPQENAAGYRRGSPIGFAEGLAGPLLLVHGSGDDNVHYQGTEVLVDKLIGLGKPFDLMVYPNRSHSISEGEGTSLHLHTLLARWLAQHVPPGPRPR